MATSHTDDAEPDSDRPRAPWYKDPTNALIAVVVIVVGAWLVHLYMQDVQNPVAAAPGAATSTAVAPNAFRKPTAPARIVQHAHTSADEGIAKATDLTDRLAHDPKEGDLLLAFGSDGFGCVAAPGWTILGGAGSGSSAVAYRLVQRGDTKVQVPFTTPRASGYTIELIEIAGGPDIVASPQVGGAFALDATVRATLALAIPQTGGVLFGLYAASGKAGGNDASIRFADIPPARQRQTLVDRVPARGWGSELIISASTTDPRYAVQPYTATAAITFAGRRAPGNIVTSWFVWVGGASDRGAARP